ncbi:MAG: hypothetical protein K2X68_10750 [Novosphingobium sp.]|nr:hypothetical protein [Novosphingobium sp.]
MFHRPAQALIATLLAGTAAPFAAPAAAQIGGVQQQQLENGFLTATTAQLSAQNLTGAEIYIRRAVDALSEGDFKRSLAILRPYRLTASYTDMLISGLAHKGLGDYAAARKDYEGALHKRRNYLAAQIALAELEAGHGDRVAAQKLLQDLTARRDACAGTCPDQAELASGVDRVNAAMLAPAQAQAPSAP